MQLSTWMNWYFPLERVPKTMNYKKTTEVECKLPSIEELDHPPLFSVQLTSLCSV